MAPKAKQVGSSFTTSSKKAGSGKLMEDGQNTHARPAFINKYVATPPKGAIKKSSTL